jgi:hypothetical protein
MYRRAEAVMAGALAGRQGLQAAGVAGGIATIQIEAPQVKVLNGGLGGLGCELPAQWLWR